MILPALLALAVILSLALGGRFDRLAQVQFRYAYLILLALGIQVLIFSAWWQTRAGRGSWTEIFYVISMLLLLVATWLNRRTVGVIPLGIGLALNATAIAVNGGHMPASLQALTTAGFVDPNAPGETLRYASSSVMSAATPLWFLGDVFAVPRGWPLANVFSVGDVLIALGAVWFVWTYTRPQRSTPAP